MTDVTKLDELSKIGREIIEAQLTLASRECGEALDDIWALGYCFGLFDAIGQRAKLDQYTEGLALISFGFSLLMSGHLEGADMVRQALDHQTDPVFAQGNQTGGADLFTWLDDTNKVPMALFTHLTSRLAT